MKARRLEHAAKNRFWEVFWEDCEAEAITGTLGTKGRARRHVFGSPMACKEFVETELASRLAQGFVEVLPETVQTKTAPRAEAAPEWLARIVEAFDDDQPRLVYADWLQVRGDPLGELITVQCERARLEPWDPKHKPLRDREEHLLAMYRSRWLPNVVGAEVEFHRGFAERVRLEHPLDREVLERVLAGAPLVRTLEVVERRESWRATLWPWELPLPTPLQSLTGLFLRGRKLEAGHVRALVEFPDLARLDRLGLRSSGIGAQDVKQLATRPWRVLDLHDNVYGVRGVAYLLEHAAQLVALDVGSAGVGDDGTRQLAAAPLHRLERLSLRRSVVTAQSLPALVQSKHLRALRVLDLSCNQLDGAAIEALCAAELPALVELDLRETSLGDAGVAALVRSPIARQLRALDLGNNGITVDGARAIADAGLPNLRQLGASGNLLGDGVPLLKSALRHARIVARSRNTTLV
ncbi:MAG TPA: TIGR02996 domain-containing protein [Kofleriaceae bacterium]|nr:TIGR02996 domain-containing protein [Kofleriaceae bacterium]